jgi:hypothetical protein
MRPATDPVLILFFLSPFVVAFVAAILYDGIEPALRGGRIRRGVVFGLLLFILLTVPNQVIISSSMYYPEGFYLAHILNGLAGYPLFGVLCAGIWSGGGLEDLRKEIRSI